jgi:hypothetical protein
VRRHLHNLPKRGGTECTFAWIANRAKGCMCMRMHRPLRLAPNVSVYNNVSGVRALWPRAHQHTHNLITLGSNNAAAALSRRWNRLKRCYYTAALGG